MSYRIYNTEGIILSIFPVREADCSYTMYTQKHGLIRVRARGVRSMQSKLRYNLQYGSCINMSLVRGKAGWQLTGVDTDKIFSSHVEPSGKIFVVGKIFKLLLQLVDEGGDYTLYQDLKEALLFLNRGEFTVAELQLFEVLSFLRVLKILGYGKQDIETLGISGSWTKDFLHTNIDRKDFLSKYLKEVLETI